MKIIQNLMMIAALSVGLSGRSYAEERSELVQLAGKSLFSFTQDHFIIETDRYFYKITKKGLSTAMLSKLENATINNESIALKISSRHIEYVWPTVALGTSCCWNGKSKTDYNATAEEIVAKVAESNGRIRLNGNLVLSLSEPYYLIQVKDAVYQLKKSALTNEQTKELNKVSLGSQISISVHQSAVNYSWNLKQNVSRNIASVEERDELSLNKSFMRLKGTVLYSANEPIVIVQSKDMVYHLKRKGILTKNPKLLDVNGSKIQLIVPVNDIEFFWSTINVKLVESGPK